MPVIALSDDGVYLGSWLASLSSVQNSFTEGNEGNKGGNGFEFCAFPVNPV
jgi:hypothetical protein